MSNEPVPQVERYQAMISQHPDVQTFKKFFQKEGNDMGLFGSRRSRHDQKQERRVWGDVC